MQKMASNKHASFGSGEKLLRCAGSLFPFLGLSLLPATRHSHAGHVHCPAPNPVPSSPSPWGCTGALKDTSHSASPTDAPLGPVNGPPNLLGFPLDASVSFFSPFLWSCVIAGGCWFQGFLPHGCREELSRVMSEWPTGLKANREIKARQLALFLFSFFLLLFPLFFFFLLANLIILKAHPWFF